MARMKTATTAPTRKAIAGASGAGIANQFADVFMYFLGQAIGHELPTEIQTALRGLLIFAVALAAAYLTPPAADEGAVPRDAT